MFSQRLLGNRISLRHGRNRARDRTRQLARLRDQQHHGVRIMLRLRHQVSRNERRLAMVTKNQPLRRTRQKIDGAIKGHNFLRRGHKQISRPHDLVYPRNAFRAVGQRRNRLRSADAVELAHSQQRRGCQRGLRRARRNHANFLHARNLRRNHRHQQS